MLETESITRIQELLSRGLSEIELGPELELDAGTASEKLARLSLMLFEWSSKLNLTGHGSPEEIASRLVMDALALAKQLPSFESLADLGSGAGFPGLPLAILFPKRRFSLVEARERRIHFQRHAIRQLGLENVSPLRGRAEELSPEPHDIVTAQAMAQLGQALSWMVPWCREGGYLIVPCGENPPELKDSEALKVLETRRYWVPIARIERTVWIGQRAGA